MRNFVNYFAVGLMVLSNTLCYADVSVGPNPDPGLNNYNHDGSVMDGSRLQMGVNVVAPNGTSFVGTYSTDFADECDDCETSTKNVSVSLLTYGIKAYDDAIGAPEPWDTPIASTVTWKAKVEYKIDYADYINGNANIVDWEQPSGSGIPPDSANWIHLDTQDGHSMAAAGTYTDYIMHPDLAADGSVPIQIPICADVSSYFDDGEPIFAIKLKITFLSNTTTQATFYTDWFIWEHSDGSSS